jgi:hypothetical protein
VFLGTAGLRAFRHFVPAAPSADRLTGAMLVALHMPSRGAYGRLWPCLLSVGCAVCVGCACKLCS